jgi:hypothetical protein
MQRNKQKVYVVAQRRSKVPPNSRETGSIQLGGVGLVCIGEGMCMCSNGAAQAVWMHCATISYSNDNDSIGVVEVAEQNRTEKEFKI